MKKYVIERGVPGIGGDILGSGEGEGFQTSK